MSKGIMERFFDALREGDPAAEAANADIRAAHLSDLSRLERQEYAAERMTDWAEDQQRAERNARWRHR